MPAICYTNGGVWPTWCATTNASAIEPWGTWVYASSSGATTVSVTATTVWPTWVSSAGMPIVPAQYVPPTRTAEEIAADNERLRISNESYKRQTEEAERKRQEAEQRAEELLLQHLDKGQRRSYRQHKKFKVIGGDGASFELTYGWAGNIREFKDDKPIARFCIHPREQVPIPDNLLAQKLMLETDPARFRQVANRTPIMAGGLT